MDDSDHRTVRRLANYKRIRVIGKGGFGTAVLYSSDKDYFIVVKQISILDLSVTERQMALNEAKVLSMLKHPNIVSYYGSFEEDGVLYIEMEYGDGGTLLDYLRVRESPMEEENVLQFFQQIVAAVHHIHDKGILHRDMKTANIFIFGDNLLKVGDFGISKIMSNVSSKAETVVGTPYYISPEMCEGKPYDKQSDIWALGCVLYEMVCLHRTFEGSNIPVLVYKIMKGQFAPITGKYSLGMRELIRSLLQKDPISRPTINEIHLSKLPELLSESSLETRNEFNQEKSPQLRSVVYSVNVHGNDIDISPIALPGKIIIVQLCCSSSHSVALTSNGLVFTWGDNSKGQLGIGHPIIYANKPQCVEALNGKQINCVGAGEGFSAFSSSNGLVLTCGDGSRGCLGHGNRHSEMKPRIVETLMSVDVSAISCGSFHVMALVSDGTVFAWGTGKQGQLGLQDYSDRYSPTAVVLSGTKVAQITCGHDSTAFATVDHHILACGSNRFNKLNLDLKVGFPYFRKSQEVEFVTVPTKIKGIADVDSVAMGQNHTAILLKNGNVLTLGNNIKGQRGVGHRDPCKNIELIDVLAGRSVCWLQCSCDCTVAGTSDNLVFAWGEVGYSVKRGSYLRKDADLYPAPREILALYSSAAQANSGITISLCSVHCQGKRLSIVVKTTAPLTHRDGCENDNVKSKVSTSYNCETSEIPCWMTDDNLDYDDIKFN